MTYIICRYILISELRNHHNTKEVKKMTNNEALERLAIMIRTNASEDTCWNYWIGTYNKMIINDRTWEIGCAILAEKFEV